MTKLVILADDLTGALDTGVQFAAFAVAIQVLVTEHLPPAAFNCDILVVDTETRHLPPKQAYKIVHHLVEQAACFVDWTDLIIHPVSSVDHGTGFDLAGTGKSNELSLVNSIDYAIALTGKRH